MVLTSYCGHSELLYGDENGEREREREMHLELELGGYANEVVASQSDHYTDTYLTSIATNKIHRNDV